MFESDRPLASRGLGFRMTLRWLEVSHLLAAFGLSCLVLAALFWREEGLLLPPWMFYTVTAGTVLALAQVLRPLLVEVYAQFHYREKFALFLVYAVMMDLPWLLGMKGWSHAFAVLVSTLGFLCIHPIGFGRLYAVTLLVLFGTHVREPIPPFPLSALWMLLFLLALRLEYVRFRMERYRREGRIGLRGVMAGALFGAVMPWVLGLMVLIVSVAWTGGDVRQLTFSPPMQSTAPMGPVTPSEVLVDAIILIALIIVSLLLIQWIEKKLRRRQSAKVPTEEDLLEANELREEVALGEEPRQAEETGADPRSRVLARFRRFCEALSPIGLQRASNETAGEYFQRLRLSVLEGWGLDAADVGLFNRSCYSDAPVAESEANGFDVRVSRAEMKLRESVRRERDPEEEE